MSDPYSPIVKLLVLVKQAQERAKNASLPDGRQDQLLTLSHRLQRIRSFQQGSVLKKRVGVFGAPKRGKSTLLNALLGEDLLPTSPIPLSTTTIEIEHDVSIQGWSLIINHESGRVEQSTCESAQEVARLLEIFGSRRGSSPPAQRLRLKGNFPDCKILAEGGVLLDTPGAEVAFETDKRLEAEAENALQALETTHLVLFCMRADQIGSKSDSEFYEKHVRSLAPIHVVTMKDKYKEDMGILIDDVLDKYGLSQSEPVLVSAHQGRKTNTRNASGMDEFEKKVLEELGKLTPVHGLLSCLHDFELAAEDYPEIRPERIHFLNLKKSIEDLDSEWSHKALSHITNKPDFWEK